MCLYVCKLKKYKYVVLSSAQNFRTSNCDPLAPNVSISDLRRTYNYTYIHMYEKLTNKTHTYSLIYFLLFAAKENFVTKAI